MCRLVSRESLYINFFEQPRGVFEEAVHRQRVLRAAEKKGGASSRSRDDVPPGVRPEKEKKGRNDHGSALENHARVAVTAR